MNPVAHLVQTVALEQVRQFAGHPWMQVFVELKKKLILQLVQTAGSVALRHV